MTTEHEARYFLTNIRVHLQDAIDKENWREVVRLCGRVEDAIEATSESREVKEELINQVEEVVKRAEKREKQACYGEFLVLNTDLINELGIPPMID